MSKREQKNFARLVNQPPGGKTILRKRLPNLVSAFRLLTEISADFFKGGRRQPWLDRREL